MAKTAMWFGVALVLLGAWGFFGTGSQHSTALIPAYFGLALGVCGLLANSPDAKKRMLWMHVAVTVGLIGFIGAAARVVVEFRNAKDAGFSHAATIAVSDQLAMAIVCLLFVGLCVRSFIAARRGGKLEA